MGKKKKQKISGAERTALKTEKKADRRAKKQIRAKGEDDIEALIADFQEKDRRREAVIEEKCSPPSPRCNMTLTPHPDKDELIMFGGEHFTGNKTYVYNDMFFFNIRNNEWVKLKVPNAPPPRCAHQAVALNQFGGQLWIFGGEFASPTQSQFYHYKDLWVYHLKEKRWEKISAPGGPSPRSGHRMTMSKKNLIVFGGFHDNLRDYKYFDDLYMFNMESYCWSRIEAGGLGPSARSGCQIITSVDQSQIIIYGGYSKEKVKKDVDKGRTFNDMFVLSLNAKSKTSSSASNSDETWKWKQIKQSGMRPSPRCGFSLISTPGNRAFLFGGVFDEEEDDEDIQGNFYNEMYSLELDSGKWHQVCLRGRKSNQERKKRRKDKKGEKDEKEESETEIEEDMTNLKVDGSDITTDSVQIDNDVEEQRIFTVIIGESSASSGSLMGSSDQQSKASSNTQDIFVPHARMNALLAVKHGILYLYGGLYEDGDKQITLSDFYTLDLHKIDEWNTIIASDLHIKLKEYVESDSGSDAVEDDEMASDAENTSDDDSSDSDCDMEQDAPKIEDEEEFSDYFSRTKDYWLDQAEKVAEKENMEVTGRRIKKAATRMAEEFFKLKKS